MEATHTSKFWSLRLEGAEGNSPTESFVEVGKDKIDGNCFQISAACFKPTISLLKGIEHINIQLSSHLKLV